MKYLMILIIIFINSCEKNIITDPNLEHIIEHIQSVPDLEWRINTINTNHYTYEWGYSNTSDYFKIELFPDGYFNIVTNTDKTIYMIGLLSDDSIYLLQRIYTRIESGQKKDVINKFHKFFLKLDEKEPSKNCKTCNKKL
jgi:hypothetical protein